MEEESICLRNSNPFAEGSVETSKLFIPMEKGYSESFSGNVIGITRCNFDQARLGKEFWSCALNYTVNVKNWCFQSGHGTTPFLKKYGVKPNVPVPSHVWKIKQQTYARDSKTYIATIPKMGEMKVVRPQSVKFNAG